MAFLRLSSSSLRATTWLGRPVQRAAPRAAAFISTTPRQLAHGDYGSTDSSPEAASKQPSSSATRSKEHPGAPAPDVGQKGPSPSSSSNKDSSSGGSGSSQKQQPSSTNNDKDPHVVKGARPKILNDNPPAEESEDVKKHNREMEQRAERADTQIQNQDAEKDKVPPGFWSGR